MIQWLYRGNMHAQTQTLNFIDIDVCQLTRPQQITSKDFTKLQKDGILTLISSKHRKWNTKLNPTS